MVCTELSNPVADLYKLCDKPTVSIKTMNLVFINCSGLYHGPWCYAEGNICT